MTPKNKEYNVAPPTIMAMVNKAFTEMMDTRSGKISNATNSMFDLPTLIQMK